MRFLEKNTCITGAYKDDGQQWGHVSGALFYMRDNPIGKNHGLEREHIEIHENRVKFLISHESLGRREVRTCCIMDTL